MNIPPDQTLKSYLAFSPRSVNTSQCWVLTLVAKSPTRPEHTGGIRLQNKQTATTNQETRQTGLWRGTTSLEDKNSMVQRNVLYNVGVGLDSP